eukprot:6179485-Prymnesium_polylepis.1
MCAQRRKRALRVRGQAVEQHARPRVGGAIGSRLGTGKLTHRELVCAAKLGLAHRAAHVAVAAQPPRAVPDPAPARERALELGADVVVQRGERRKVFGRQPGPAQPLQRRRQRGAKLERANRAHAHLPAQRFELRSLEDLLHVCEVAR